MSKLEDVQLSETIRETLHKLWECVGYVYEDDAVDAAYNRIRQIIAGQTGVS